MKTKWKVVSPYTGIEEDAPASSAGGGTIAGIGIDHPDRPGSGEPGIDPKKKKKRHTLIDRDGKIDGRTKAYREHRKKLEAAREKRNTGKSSKFIENIKKKTSEMAYGQGYNTAKPMADMSNRNMPKKKKK
jgi:hypothetical protein